MENKIYENFWCFELHNTLFRACILVLIMWGRISSYSFSIIFFVGFFFYKLWPKLLFIGCQLYRSTNTCNIYDKYTIPTDSAGFVVRYDITWVIRLSGTFSILVVYRLRYRILLKWLVKFVYLNSFPCFLTVFGITLEI